MLSKILCKHIFRVVTRDNKRSSKGFQDPKISFQMVELYPYVDHVLLGDGTRVLQRKWLRRHLLFRIMLKGEMKLKVMIRFFKDLFHDQPNQPQAILSDSE
jgi:hypothetical protein